MNKANAYLGQRQRGYGGLDEARGNSPKDATASKDCGGVGGARPAANFPPRVQ